MDAEKKKAEKKKPHAKRKRESSALSSLTNTKRNGDTKPPTPRKCHTGSYAEEGSDGHNDSESDDEFYLKKKKQKKTQAQTQTKQVASTTTTGNWQDKRKAERQAAKQRKTEEVKPYNDKLRGFKDTLNKEKGTSGLVIGNSTTKKQTVKLSIDVTSSGMTTISFDCSSKFTISFDEQETMLISEVVWAKDYFWHMMLQFQAKSSNAEKLQFLERLADNPSLWNALSLSSPSTNMLALLEAFNKGRTRKAQYALNYENEADLFSTRKREITSRALVNQPVFDMVRKCSIVKQMAKVVLKKVGKNLKPKAKAKKPEVEVTVDLQSTSERASAALANGRPGDVIMKRNPWAIMHSHFVTRD